MEFSSLNKQEILDELRNLQEVERCIRDKKPEGVKVAGRVSGILRGYLPYTGYCELEYVDGGSEMFNFAASLCKITKADPKVYIKFINRIVFLFFDDQWKVIKIEPTEQ